LRQQPDFARQPEASAGERAGDPARARVGGGEERAARRAEGEGRYEVEGAGRCARVARAEPPHRRDQGESRDQPGYAADRQPGAKRRLLPAPVHNASIAAGRRGES